ncbi:MFS transporter [Nocardia sp. GTS18]|uniref:MFS transporter n=1 Tax=Nocardia sp. GTS18 TaxID=1778064 RepID=UPI0015EE7D17|nr:MFS transporter [Nocardia sp. GTS18]
MIDQTTRESEAPHDSGGLGTNLVFLALAAAAFALAQTAIVPGIMILGHELHASTADVGWVLTGYLISAAILTPVFGRLGDMYGKKKLLVIALGLFALGSVAAALAPSIWVLVAARVVQGAGGGIFPLCYGIIGDTFPAEKRGGALGLISALAGIGAGGGLLIGGLLIDHLSWQWVFWSGAIMSAIALVGVLRVPERSIPTPTRIDFAGIALLSIGLTMPLLALSRGSTWGWTDARTLGLVLGGLVVLIGFVAFETRVGEPLIDMHVLRRPTVLITNIAMLLFGAGMFAVFSLIPQLAQTPDTGEYGFGMDATGSGLLMIPGSIAMLAAAVVAGRLVGRVRAAVPLVLGALTAAAGFAALALAHGSQGAVIGFTVVTFVGIGLGMAAMPNLIMSAVPAEKTAESTGVNALIRSVGSSIGSQVAATVLAGSVVAGTALPADSGFTTAFWLAAGAIALAAVVAVFIPQSKPPAATSVREDRESDLAGALAE